MNVTELKREGAAAATPADLTDLETMAEARAELRLRIDKSELRLAARDLTEGLRGLIRAAPLSALLVAAGAGALFARRRRRR